MGDTTVHLTVDDDDVVVVSQSGSGAALARGPVGPRGLTGPTGPQGEPGTSGSALHADLTDTATEGHPASAITGLGDSAVLDVGTTTGTVAAGDDDRFRPTDPGSIGTPDAFQMSPGPASVSALVSWASPPPTLSGGHFEIQVAADSGFTTVLDHSAYPATAAATPIFILRTAFLNFGVDFYTRLRAVDCYGNTSAWMNYTATNDGVGAPVAWQPRQIDLGTDVDQGGYVVPTTPADPADDGKVWTADSGAASWVTPAAGGGGVSTHAELSDLATSGHPASVIAFTPTGSIAATTVQAAVAEVATDAAAAYQPLDADLTAVAALTTPATTISGAVQQSSNLSDLASASTARTNLGLGGAAVLSVGTGAGTVAAGDDSRLSNARTPTAHASSHAGAGSDPITALGPVTVLTTGAAVVPLIAKGAAAQTANLQEWQISTGAVKSAILPDGSMWANDRVSLYSAVAGKVHTITSYYGLTYNTHDGGGHYFTSTSQTEPIMRISNSAAAQQVLLVRGAAAQTANLQEWQDSTGVAEAYITSNRDLRLTGTYPNAGVPRGLLLGGASPGYDPGKFIRVGDGAQLQVARDGYGYGFDLYSVASIGLRIKNISGGQTAHVPLVLQGAASQTANLQDWKDSAGAVLASVTAAGLHKWASGNEQTTVGAAGAASALPASPTKYLKVVGSDGTTYVVPAFLAA